MKMLSFSPLSKDSLKKLNLGMAVVMALCLIVITASMVITKQTEITIKGDIYTWSTLMVLGILLVTMNYYSNKISIELQ